MSQGYSFVRYVACVGFLQVWSHIALKIGCIQHACTDRSFSCFLVARRAMIIGIKYTSYAVLDLENISPPTGRNGTCLFRTMWLSEPHCSEKTKKYHAAGGESGHSHVQTPSLLIHRVTRVNVEAFAVGMHRSASPAHPDAGNPHPDW